MKSTDWKKIRQKVTLSGTKGMQIFNEMIKHINKSKEFSGKKVHFNRSQNFRIIIK